MGRVPMKPPAMKSTMSDEDISLKKLAPTQKELDSSVALQEAWDEYLFIRKLTMQKPANQELSGDASYDLTSNKNLNLPQTTPVALKPSKNWYSLW